MIKKISLIIVILVLISISIPVAAERGLEIRYPDVGGETITPEVVESNINEYVKYIYWFLITLGGIIGFGSLVYSGFVWMTSSGNPAKIQDAKSRIFAALIGLIVLFGSQLILWNINADFIKFELKPIKPTIAELPSGVLACDQAIDIMGAWKLQREHIDSINSGVFLSSDRLKEIKEKMSPVLAAITEHCHHIVSEGDIRPELDNRITHLYFIPDIFLVNLEECEGFYFDYLNSGYPGYGFTYEQFLDDLEKDGFFCQKEYEFGAVIFEDQEFNGNSKAYYDHLKDKDGGWQPYERVVNSGLIGIEVSSIKPFQLIYNPHPSWETVLYEWYDLNIDKSEGEIVEGKRVWPEGADSGPGFRLPENYWYNSELNLPWPPLSMNIKGHLIVILQAPGFKAEDVVDETKIRSEAFQYGIYNNLEAYPNISQRVGCDVYFSQHRNGVCWRPSATKIIMISADFY